MKIPKQARNWLDQRLAARSPRERQMLIWGAAVGLLLVLVLGCWMPLQQAQSRLERSVAVERKRLAVMGAVLHELASIDKRAGEQSPPALSRQSIEELARNQLSPSALDVRLEGENRVKIIFSGVQMAKLVEWINELSRTQRIHLSFARLRAEGATVSGEIQFSGPEP